LKAIRAWRRSLAACLVAGAFGCGAAIGEPGATPADTRLRAPTEGWAETTARDGAAIDPQRFGAKLPDEAYGAFQRGLYITAYNLALPRAESGNPAAQTLVAEILARGLGRRSDPAAAARWYQAAAEQGIPEAQFQYALMLLDGRFVAKDEKGAFALMEAAAQAGNKLAQFNLAQLLVRREPGEAGLRRAVPYYERASDAGLADAQYAMSQVLSTGTGGRTRDDEAARKLLENAARQNFDTAQYDLGYWYLNGRGGARDYRSGFNWLMRAAQSGNVAAQNAVARLYMQGIGTEPDTAAAAAWYVLAKRSGLSDPQMEDFLRGLEDADIRAAVEQANRLR
jgi:TPR repeat protein